MAPTNNFMPNQIQLMQSYEIRDRVAAMLINSTKGTNDKSIFFHLVRNGKPGNPFLSREELRLKLGNIVKINQVGELNTINISADGPSFKELIMITNVYANEYIKYLYEMKMQDISTLKKFVGVEKEKKLGELNEVETQLEDFKNRHGFVDLESYSQNVVDRINEDKNQIVIAQAEVETIDKTLKLLKVQLSTYDSSLVDYMQLQLDQA